MLIGAIVVTSVVGYWQYRKALADRPWAYPDPPQTIEQTLTYLRQAHVEGAYQRLTAHLTPDARKPLVDLLIAIDEVLVANRGTQTAIKEACPQVDPRWFDVSFLADWLELFSDDLTVIRVDRQAGRGTVTAQVGDRMPLVYLNFERNQGRWVYQSGPIDAALIPLVRDVARALDQVTQSVASETHATPEAIQREFEVRLKPRLERIRALAAEST